VAQGQLDPLFDAVARSLGVSNRRLAGALDKSKARDAA
jgi:hypothetical protein